MNALRSLPLLATLLAAPSQAAAPQAAPPAPAAASPSAAPPAVSLLGDVDKATEGNNGEWAEYALLADGKPQLEATIRVVLVPDEKGVWLELWMDKTGRTAVRAREDSPTLMKLGSGVFEVPTEEPAAPACSAPGGVCQPSSSGELAEAKKKPDSLKLVPLKVVAGTFQCQKTVRNAGKDQVVVWKSDQVPGLRMVRALYPGGRGFELVAFGKDGRSAFPARYKVAPFPFGNLKNLERLMPSNPNGTAPTAAPAAAPAPAPEPAPLPPLQPFDPGRAKKP